MTSTVLVNLAGVLAIAWIVWYFFLSRRQSVVTATAVAGVQEIEILVKGGYKPDVVRVAPNVPLRLRFRREETSACSEEIVFPDFGVKRSLPAFATTAIDLPASPPGTYRFACGMDMLHGSLVVGDGGAVVADDHSQKRSCCATGSDAPSA